MNFPLHPRPTGQGEEPGDLEQLRQHYQHLSEQHAHLVHKHERLHQRVQRLEQQQGLSFLEEEDEERTTRAEDLAPDTQHPQSGPSTTAPTHERERERERERDGGTDTHPGHRGKRG